jgi:hypothetical protein
MITGAGCDRWQLACRPIIAKCTARCSMFTPCSYVLMPMVCSKSLQVFLGLRSAHCAKCAGAGRVGGDNGASPQEAPPDIRYRAQCRSREVCRGRSAVWLLALGRHQLLRVVAYVSSHCLCLAGRLQGRCGDHDCVGRRTQVQRRRCATQEVPRILGPASAESYCCAQAMSTTASSGPT